VNFVFGVDFTDEFRVMLIEESTVAVESQGSQAHSQTDWITAYRLLVHEGSAVPFILTIIDTPGFGDTRGIKRDERITKQLQAFFTNKQGIQYLDAILFVTQASLARLTSTQQYVFDSVLSIFGKDIADNIMVCFTFADGQPPQTKAAIDAAGIPYAENFKFNNSATFVGPDGDDGDDFNTMFWNMGKKSMKHFFLKLALVEPTSLVMTRDTLAERDRLENALNSMQPQLAAARAKMDEFKTEAVVVNKMKAQITENKDFKYTVQTPHVVQVNLRPGETTSNCTHCNMTCHFGCPFTDDQRASCYIFGGSRRTCSVCPAACGPDRHKNMNFRIDTEIVTEQKTYGDLEKRYRDASGKRLSAEAVLNRLSCDVEGMSKVVISLIDVMRRSKNRLSQIALKPSHMDSVEYIDVMIQSEKSQGKPGFMERVQELHVLRDKVSTMMSAMKDDFDPMKQYKDDPDVKGALSTMQQESSAKCVIC